MGWRNVYEAHGFGGSIEHGLASAPRVWAKSNRDPTSLVYTGRTDACPFVISNPAGCPIPESIRSRQKAKSDTSKKGDGPGAWQWVPLSSAVPAPRISLQPHKGPRNARRIEAIQERNPTPVRRAAPHDLLRTAALTVGRAARERRRARYPSRHPYSPRFRDHVKSLMPANTASCQAGVCTPQV